MSKLTDIKYSIDQLDGGTFQNLCDIYLSRKGYGTGYSLGMKTGTNKTAKGNPDTYFLTTDNKYVFVMYTTQKDNFVDKALEDLKKCFNYEKTGLTQEDISEIVYCHTAGRLSPGDHQKLHNFCAERDTILTLIGLDELGNDLYLKYPRLAKDFLNICIDTGQISNIHDFILLHDANKMSAPLSTEFLFREKELQDAKEKLNTSDILILTGPAGVGKTRLALKLCEDLANENNWEPICIKSNTLELYDDLVAAIDPDKNHLIFVDDANELSGLHLVLSLLPQSAVERKNVKKIIITVRDYARQQVVQQVLNVEKPEILKIGLLNDESIKKMMEIAFGITNHIYLDRIVSIAEGNARLAMLTGKIAKETQNISSIQDATTLYEHYYEKQLQSISNSSTGIASAGIISFFEALHLDHLNRIHPILSAFGITDEQLISDLKTFHEQELVDLCHDKAAKISDQSFSNYLIKYVFVDQKIIPLSTMIEHSFFINKIKTIAACNILLNVFYDESTKTYIEEQINIVWDKLLPDSENFFAFFRSFYRVRPTEALILLKSLIDKEDSSSFDILSIDFKQANTEKSIDNDIINILCGFDFSQLPEAIELLLQYYQKRPDLFEQIYSALAFKLGIDKNSEECGYNTQKIVVEQLCQVIDKNSSTENIFLFICVAKQFLNLSFSNSEPGRKNTYIFYNISLSSHETVLAYRKTLLNQLYNIYSSNRFNQEIESLLMDYCCEYGSEIDYRIVKEDLISIMPFFTILSCDKLRHCVLAEHVNNIAEKADFGSVDSLIPFLDSPKYKVYNILNTDRKESVRMGWHEYESWHENQVKQHVQDYDLIKMQFLLEVCNECLDTVDHEARLLSTGIDYAINAFSQHKNLYIEVVSAYLDANTPYNIHPSRIIENLFKIMSAEQIKELICLHNFSQKNVWLWYFYVELPESDISAYWANELLLYLDDIPQDIKNSPYRPIEEIEKYECVVPDIIIKASRIIASRYEKSPFIFNLYFFLMLNTSRTDVQKTIKKYKNDIPLLEDIYLKCITYSHHEDHNGQFLAELIKEDFNFLFSYLDKMIELEPRFYSYNNEWSRRLDFIWKDDSYLIYMDRISNHIFKNCQENPRLYSSTIGSILLHKKGETSISQRQDQWIEATIATYHQDIPRMHCLFAAIDEHSANRRRSALKKLLSVNSNFDVFERLPLEASHWGGMGSMIPYMQERVTYLESILPLFSGIVFIKHRQRVERKIASWKDRIKSTEIEELLESIF